MLRTDRFQGDKISLDVIERAIAKRMESVQAVELLEVIGAFQVPKISYDQVCVCWSLDECGWICGSGDVRWSRSYGLLGSSFQLNLRCRSWVRHDSDAENSSHKHLMLLLDHRIPCVSLP